MYCDNCLLLFPLRGGAIILAGFIALYNFIGSVILFLYGEFWYFTQYEPQAYGGIGMAIGFLAVVCIVALTTRSYMLTRLLFYIGPFILFISAVKLALMLFRLNAYQDNICWECNNGRQLWNATLAAESYVPPPASTASLVPAEFCNIGFHALYMLFTFGLAIDLILQLYLYFMTWRYKAYLEQAYKQFSGPIGGIYAA